MMTEEQNDPEAAWITARLELLGLFVDFTATPEAALNEGLKQRLYLSIVDVCKAARAMRQEERPDGR
jgi:hypothetical protein